MLDTGSTRTAIADDLAPLVPARIVARAEVLSGAGSEMHDVVRLERVEVAGARAAVLLATVVPATRLNAIGPEIRGILGQDFLSAFNYTLDYRRRRLTWDDANAVSCEGRAALPLVQAEGRYLVRVTRERTTQSLRLVPDTGSDSLVFFSSSRADTRATAFDQVSVSSLTGSRNAGVVPAPPLVVGGTILRSARAIVIERDEADADGLLPLHLFASVSFNMRDGCMVVRGR